jgi:hypothetical protein
MSVNARKEDFQEVELFGKPALFTNSRIERATVPDGWYAYDLRGSDYDPGRPVTIEAQVVVNHAGANSDARPVKFRKDQHPDDSVTAELHWRDGHPARILRRSFHRISGGQSKIQAAACF